MIFIFGLVYDAGVINCRMILYTVGENEKLGVVWEDAVMAKFKLI
jgi:hypothetical protein